MKRVIGYSLCAVMVVSMTACSSVDDTHNHPDLTTGEQLFNHHCASCHGEDGTGHLVDRTPANILTKRGREGIVDYITTNVGENRKMPVFSAMPREEAEKIAAHLLELKRRYDALDENKKKSEGLMLKP